MDQTGQPDCACTLKTGVDPCDAKFGGKFKKADGSDCPAVDGGDDADDGDEDSKASMLLAGALVIAATLFV